MVWSRIFFKETFTAQKIAGLTLVLIGVIFVSLGAARTASATASHNAPSPGAQLSAPQSPQADPR